MTGRAEEIAEALERATSEADELDRELAEIALLEQAARTEATRHDQRREQVAERLALLQARPDADPGELRETVNQLVTLVGRASLMQGQVDVLEGKQKALTRFRDRLVSLLETFGTAPEIATVPRSAEPPVPAVLARAVMAAQEDLRRDIARAMHDGPAQSLTNIVLQAQIVHRLVQRDPERAAIEGAQLVDMVQKTLEATKAFIFDVRPMVLDDLGLVPTLRRVARDRGRRARIPVEFDSMGADRRLPREVESEVFRVLDDAINGFLETEPSRLTVSLDWAELQLHARVCAVHTGETVLALPAGEQPPIEADGDLGTREQGNDLPPMLAAMIREQREGAAAARSTAEQTAIRDRSMPAHAWKEIHERATTAGLEVDLTWDGRCLEVLATLPASGAGSH